MVNQRNSRAKRRGKKNILPWVIGGLIVCGVVAVLAIKSVRKKVFGLFKKKAVEKAQTQV